MEQNNVYRHELKYGIDYADYLTLRSRLKQVMKPDEHVGSDGRYLIRSIYFDNYEDKALREKSQGVQKREKFRIRWYNDDFSLIQLEKKMKWNSLCLKKNATLTQKECEDLCNGDYDWMMFHSSGLVHELYFKIMTQQLRPRVVVSYLREPYVYEAGNVRVTFDSHIRTSLFGQDYCKENRYDISVTDKPGDMVLEIKYDDFLPEIIALLIQTENIRQQSFSKYGVCRRFG